jgi:hypothetical protein
MWLKGIFLVNEFANYTATAQRLMKSGDILSGLFYTYLASYYNSATTSIQGLENLFSEKYLSKKYDPNLQILFDDLREPLNKRFSIKIVDNYPFLLKTYIEKNNLVLFNTIEQNAGVWDNLIESVSREIYNLNIRYKKIFWGNVNDNNLYILDEDLERYLLVLFSVYNDTITIHSPQYGYFYITSKEQPQMIIYHKSGSSIKNLSSNPEERSRIVAKVLRESCHKNFVFEADIYIEYEKDDDEIDRWEGDEWA